MFDRKFKMRQVVSNFSEQTNICFEFQDHFGLRWCLSMSTWDQDKVSVCMWCMREKDPENPWSIETIVKFMFPTVSGKQLPNCPDVNFVYTGEDPQGYDLVGCNEQIMDAIRDDTLIIDCEVKILSMKGIPQMRFMSFKAPDEVLTDVVVEVGTKKFYLTKAVLVNYSTYFKSYYFGDLNHWQTAELKQEDPEDFHSLIEILYGHKALHDDNVLGVLKLATFLDVQKVKDWCEQCISASERIDKRMKLKLADENNLVRLKEHCYNDIKTLNDWKAYMPANSQDLQQATLALFADKIHDLEC